MQTQLYRSIYMLTGLLACLCGIVGIVLPLVPTTPFLLLSAFCFSKSSNSLHQWLLSQPVLGRVIEDWEQSGVITLKTKLIASACMMTMVSVALIIVENTYWVMTLVVVITLLVLAFIWSRPSRV